MSVTTEQVLEAISRASTQIDLDKFDASLSFEELGADSLDVFNVMLEIQEMVGKEIPDEDIENLQSPQALLEYLNRAN